MWLDKGCLATFKGHRVIFKTVTYGEDLKVKFLDYGKDYKVKASDYKSGNNTI